MTITALTQDDTELYQQTYYSIGGGFIVDEEHFEHAKHTEISVPFPYQNAADILKHCDDNGLPLSSVVMKNEIALHGKTALSQHLQQVWQTMKACIQHGINTEGLLPGPLKVPRRAAKHIEC